MIRNTATGLIMDDVLLERHKNTELTVYINNDELEFMASTYALQEQQSRFRFFLLKMPIFTRPNEIYRFILFHIIFIP